MKGDEAVMRLDVTLEGGTLVVRGEGFIIAVAKDQSGILFEVGIGEDIGRVGGIDREVAFSSHPANRFDAGRDVVVDVTLAVGSVVAGVDEDSGLLAENSSGEREDGEEKSCSGQDGHRSSVSFLVS